MNESGSDVSKKLTSNVVPSFGATKWKNVAAGHLAIEPLASEESEQHLRIGDHISLFSIDYNGYLSTDGFSEEVSSLKKVPTSGKGLAPHGFETCTFEIVPRFKYDAQVTLDDLLSIYGRERESIGLYEDGDAAVEQKLKTAAEHEVTEKHENVSEYHRVCGKNVTYGQVVQLRHTKSKAFLSLTVKEAAEIEKDALRVILEPDGSEGSWFIIAPRLKMRTEGEPVNMGDQVAFISKKFNLFLHCAMKTSKSEINGSHEFASWRVIPFSFYYTPSETRYLQAGDVVRIFHKEVEGFLTNEKLSDDSLVADANAVAANNANSVSPNGNITKKPESLFFECYVPHHGNKHRHQASNSNALWLIELENTMRGGIIHYDKYIRFKHIPTGKYMACEFAHPDGDSGSNSTVTSTDSTPDITNPPSQPAASGGNRLADFVRSKMGIKKGTPATAPSVSPAPKLASIVPTAVAAFSSSPSFLSQFAVSHKLRLFMTDDPNTPAGLFSLHSVNSPNLTEGPIEGDAFLRVRHRDTKCWLHADMDDESKKARKHHHHHHHHHGYAHHHSNHYSSDRSHHGSHEHHGHDSHDHNGHGHHRQHSRDDHDKKQDSLHGQHGSHHSHHHADEESTGIRRMNVDARSLFYDSDVFVFAPVQSSDVRSLYQVLGEIHYLQSYLITLSRAAQHGFYQNDPRMSKWLSNDSRKLVRVLGALVEGCIGTTGSRIMNSSTTSGEQLRLEEEMHEGGFHHSHKPALSIGLPNTKMQNLLREQNIADVLVAILAKPFRGKSPDQIEEFKSQPENYALLNICRLSYHLLRHLAIDNPLNRTYLSRYVPFMFSQVGLSIKSAATLMELFTDNYNLLSHITEAQIKTYFLDTLIERPVLRYIKFLSVLCECEHLPLAKNQDLIAKVLIGQHGDAFLPVQDVPARFGQKEILVRMPTKSSFHWVSLPEFVSTHATHSKTMSYLVSSIELISQMCLGGNPYTCALVSKHITVEMVNRCLSNEALPAVLRAAFCHLLINLMLADKDLSKPVPFLNYTRLWADINREFEMQRHLAGEDSGTRTTLAQSADSVQGAQNTPLLTSKRARRASIGRASEFQFTPADLNRTKHFIFAHLKHAANAISGPGSDDNRLTAAVVEMTRNLFSFGQFNHHEILQLVPCLLQVMQENIFPASYLYFDQEDKNHISINPFEKSPLTKDIMDFKYGIGRILDMACDYRTDCRLTQLLVHYKRKITKAATAAAAAAAAEEAKKQDGELTALQAIEKLFPAFGTPAPIAPATVKESAPSTSIDLTCSTSAASTSTTSESTNGASSEPAKTGTEASSSSPSTTANPSVSFNPSTDPLLKSKTSTTVTGSVAASLAADAAIVAPLKSILKPSLAPVVAENIGTLVSDTVGAEPHTPSLEDIFEILALEDKTYLPILNDMILHNHPALASLGSRLLVRHFSQRRELLDALRGVQILVDEQLVVTYQEVSRSIAKLRRLIVLSSNAADDSMLSQHHDSSIGILESLIALVSREKLEDHNSFTQSVGGMRSPTPPPSIRENHQKIREHQRLMLNLRVYETIFDFMKVDAAKVNLRLMTLCYDFFQCLCKGPYPEGQACLFKSLDSFLEHIDDEDLSLHAAHTIQTIFHNNRAICSQVTDTHIRKILNQVSNQKLPIYLDILHAIAVVDGKPVRRNQNLIAKLLVEKQNDVVVLYNDPASLRRRNEMINDLQFLNDNSELLYHVKLLELFVISCKGKVYEAEVKFQSLFSLDDIFFQVSDRANWPKIKTAYLALLEEVYLVTERSLKNIAQAPQIWELMEVFIRDINSHVNSEFSSLKRIADAPERSPGHTPSASDPPSPRTLGSIGPSFSTLLTRAMANEPIDDPAKDQHPNTVKSKPSARRGMLQVNPELLNQIDNQSTSLTTGVSEDKPAASRVLQRRSNMEPPRSSSPSLSSSRSAPHLHPSQEVLDATANAMDRSSKEDETPTNTNDTSMSASTSVADRPMLRRGGGSRSLRSLVGSQSTESGPMEVIPSEEPVHDVVADIPLQAPQPHHPVGLMRKGDTSKSLALRAKAPQGDAKETSSDAAVEPPKPTLSLTEVTPTPPAAPSDASTQEASVAKQPVRGLVRRPGFGGSASGSSAGLGKPQKSVSFRLLQSDHKEDEEKNPEGSKSDDQQHEDSIRTEKPEELPITTTSDDSDSDSSESDSSDDGKEKKKKKKKKSYFGQTSDDEDEHEKQAAPTVPAEPTESSIRKITGPPKTESSEEMNSDPTTEKPSEEPQLMKADEKPAKTGQEKWIPPSDSDDSDSDSDDDGEKKKKKKKSYFGQTSDEEDDKPKPTAQSNSKITPTSTQEPDSLIAENSASKPAEKSLKNSEGRSLTDSQRKKKKAKYYGQASDDEETKDEEDSKDSDGSVDSDDDSDTSSSSASSDSEYFTESTEKAKSVIDDARKRDADRIARAEQEAIYLSEAERQRQEEEAAAAAVKRKHFYEFERGYLFDGVLPFVSHYCQMQLSTKKLEASKLDKLNEVVDAVFTLTQITNLLPAHLDVLQTTMEVMLSRNITGTEYRKNIHSYVTTNRKKNLEHGRSTNLTRRKTQPLGSALSSGIRRDGSTPVVSPSPLGPNSPSPGTEPPRPSSSRGLRRTKSWRDLANAETSEAVTKGIAPFHNDCEQQLKPDTELVGLALVFKKDIQNNFLQSKYTEKSSLQSISSKLMHNLADPEYLFHMVSSQTHVVTTTLKAFRLILLESRVAADEEDVDDSFPGIKDMFESAELQTEHSNMSYNDFKLPHYESNGVVSIKNNGVHSELKEAIFGAFSVAFEKESAEADHLNHHEEMLVAAQDHLNDIGFTHLVLKLITSHNDAIVQESIRCGIALLWGGNKRIQEGIYELFKNHTEFETFFHDVRNRIRKGMFEVEERKEFSRKIKQALDSGDPEGGNDVPAELPESHFMSAELRSSMADDSDSDDDGLDLDDADLEDDMEFGFSLVPGSSSSQSKDSNAMQDLLRLLQLLCEGHYLPLQDHLRVQTHNLQSYDLITETASYLEALERNIDDGSVATACQVFATLTEYCQGPCVENQISLTRTKICESVNYILHHGNIQCDKAETIELHSECLTTLLALLEGVGNNQAIPRHMLAALDFDLIGDNVKTIITDITHVLAVKGYTQSRAWTQGLSSSRAIFDTSEFDEVTDSMIELGYLYFFLLRTLNDYDDSGKILAILQTFPPENFFASAVGSLEIVRSGQLERVYFRIPAICSHLTLKSKEDLIRNVNRTTQQEKIEDMFETGELLLGEMEHRASLSKSSKFSFLSNHEDTFKNLSFGLALLINFLIIISYTSPVAQNPSDSSPEEVTTSATGYNISPWIVFIMFILGSFQVGFSGITLFTYALSYTPLRLRKKWNFFGDSLNFLPSSYRLIINSAFIVLSDTYFMYYLCYLLCSLLGIWNLPAAPYFFAFQLLDIVMRSEILKYVIKSVTANGKAIMLTACLALVVVYIYSIFGFLFFRSKFNEDARCENMLMCLVTSINLGLRSGGGIGDVMEPPLWEEPDTKWRILYDSTFFFLVIVIMLNIIFGIIIDTFGELRAQNKEIEEDIQNKCFICGIERDTFDRNANGFEHHIRHEHDVFHYIYFFMYLKKKERTEYNGPEQYVADLIAAKDWSFVPILKAMCLDDDTEEDDEKSVQILNGVHHLTKVSVNNHDQLKKGVLRRYQEIEEKIERDNQRAHLAVAAMNDSLNQRMTDYELKLGSLENKIDLLVTLLSQQSQTIQYLGASAAANSSGEPIDSRDGPSLRMSSLRNSRGGLSASQSPILPLDSSANTASPSSGGIGGLRTLRSASKSLNLSQSLNPSDSQP